MVTLGAAVHSCARGNRPRQAEELCLGDVRVALKVVKWDPKKNVGGELKKQGWDQTWDLIFGGRSKV